MTINNRQQVHLAPTRASDGLCALAALLALIAAAGHFAGVATMRSAFMPGTDVKFNTVLGLIAAALAIAAVGRLRRITETGGLLVTLLGAATLIEYVTGRNFGIDELFVVDRSATLQHGRMSPHAALMFMLCGAALLTISFRRISAVTAGFGASFCVLTLFTNVYAAESFYSRPGLTPISTASLIAFTFAFVAILRLHASPQWFAIVKSRSRSAVLLRRILIFAVVVVPILGWLRLGGEAAGVLDSRYGASLLISITILITAILTSWSASQLDIEERGREKAEQSLRAAFDVLSARAAFIESSQSAMDVLLTDQRQVAQLAERLAATNQELEAFTYSVSHDLRAPLRIIDGFSRELARGAQGLDEQSQHYIQRILAAVKRMNGLIEDLLRLSKISRAAVSKSRVDVTGIAEQVVAELREHDPERNVGVRIEPGLEVVGDRALVQIVLSNLIANAWKFTAKKAEAQIELGSAGSDGSSTTLFVRDNGAGFDLKYATKLFSPFQRLHSASEFEGIGIGLTIVQRILNKHGGRIWAEAEPGRGATFSITFPTETPN